MTSRMISPRAFSRKQGKHSHFHEPPIWSVLPSSDWKMLWLVIGENPLSQPPATLITCLYARLVRVKLNVNVNARNEFISPSDWKMLWLVLERSFYLSHNGLSLFISASRSNKINCVCLVTVLVPFIQPPCARIYSFWNYLCLCSME